MRRFGFRLGCAGLVVLNVGTFAAAPPDSTGLPSAATKHWTADNGNGTYSNPLFYEEFEDPDVIRVGEDYYLAGTTMHMNPAVQLMHSKDLVNWELAGYCMDRLDLGPGVPARRREHLRPGHLGALHPLSQRHVLCLLQRQRRRASRSSAPSRSEGPGSATNCPEGTTCRCSSMTTARSTSSPATAVPIRSKNSRRTSGLSLPMCAKRY